MDNSSRKKIFSRKKQLKNKAQPVEEVTALEEAAVLEEVPVLDASKHDEVTSADEVPSATEAAPELEDSSVIKEDPVQEESTNTEVPSATEETPSAEETPAVEGTPATEAPSTTEETPSVEVPSAEEDIPVTVESIVPDDVDRLLKKIKMEITFSDESTINKEIVISENEWKTIKAPKEEKMPWIAAAVLACIVCASFTTGIFHWYNTYYRPAEAVVPGYIDTSGDRTPNNTTGGPADGNANGVTEQGKEEPDQPDQPTGPRYGIEPLPEFLSLWEKYNNEDIVAVLTLAEEEFIVVQSYDNAFYITHDINRNTSSSGWVFMDHQIDMYIGSENNMVLYDPVGEFLRQIIQEYADYDFFLRNSTILLSSLYGDFEWEIFSYYVAPADFPFAIVNQPDDDEWGGMVEQFTKASLYNTMLDVNMEDQVLTIAVPTNIDPELFYILQARMLRQITS